MARQRNQVSLTNTLNLKQRELLLDYAKSCACRAEQSLGSFRTLLEYRDKAYQRQLNITNEHIKAVRENIKGNAHKLQDLTVPIVMPQIESAVAYQAGVYLTSHPIFGVVSTPQNADAASKFETVLGDHSIKYGWPRELIKVFRDGFKYNFGAAVCRWKKTPFHRVTTNTTSTSAAGTAALKEYAYGGNCIDRLDPYNCFMDMTVPPAKLHSDGEFFGWNEVMSRIQLKKLFSVLDSDKTTSATEAFESQFAGTSSSDMSPNHYYVPQINKFLDIGQVSRFSDQNWLAWAGLEGERNRINYKNCYMVTHFYCRALSSDFAAVGNQLKVFHAIIVNWQHVIFVEELNVAYDYLPVFVMQPYEDGLGYQTQSMLDNALPFQDMSSALWSMSLESKRRAVFDRLIYNPSLINKADIDPASSVARIPLRNAAMAAKDDNPMARAIYQIPYREDNIGSNLQMSEMISGMADQASGQNKVDRGQFQPGNKTKTEFEETMGNSNSRQQLCALTIEHQFMTPLKEVIKANTLQFQAAGDFLNREQREVMNVDPVALREAMLEFKLTDGNLPAERLLNSDLLMVFLQTAQALPAVQTEYDVMGMFIYWMKLRGAYWVEDFRRDEASQQEFLQTLQATRSANEPAAPQAAQPEM